MNIVALYLIVDLLKKRQLMKPSTPTIGPPDPSKPKGYSFDEEKFAPFYNVGETCPQPNKRLGPKQICANNRVTIRLK
jgi:hypothetical protein